MSDVPRHNITLLSFSTIQTSPSCSQSSFTAPNFTSYPCVQPPTMPSPTPPSQTPSTSTLAPSPSQSPSPDPEKSLPPSPPSLTQFGPAPDGGPQAWLNAFGGFCIFFGCLGFTSCFGVLQEYYSSHILQHKSPSEIAWIGSLSSFIQFGGGAVGGPMFDRYGVKVCFE